MSSLETMLAEIQAENGFGVLLLAQMDGVPDTVQLMIATTEFDESVNGLRDKSRYLVRAIGVQEQRVSVGIFKSALVKAEADHPLLYEYNTPPAALFFRGETQNPDALLLKVFQAYSQVFGPWRQVPTYLNTGKPLMDVFTGGGDLVGEMPQPLADTLVKVFESEQLETKVMAGQRAAEMPAQKVLLLDDSYVVAADFSVEALGT